VIAVSLIVSGSCDGPIDQIFRLRDKTGCDSGPSVLGYPIGQTKEIGAVTMFMFLVFSVFYYVLYKLWKSTFKNEKDANKAKQL
jgi:hypothetical protein